MRQLLIVAVVAMALGCESGPVSGDAGSANRSDAWVLPPIEYEACPAECAMVCVGDFVSCENDVAACHGCLGRCPSWLPEDGGDSAPLASCSSGSAACSFGAVACMRRTE